MIHFIQIDGAGRILRSGNAPCRHLKDLPGANSSFRRVPHPVPDPNAFYWDGGLVAVPAAPTPFHHFDVASRCWALDLAQAWAAVRAQRDTRLAACDWVTLRAQETGEPVPEAWRVYRQALRDITGQPDPLAITWPEAPD
ncbi:tail fiber assembly protein [Delftia sp. WY8]|uniref:tail fiber assembly protein n=1 Tax=Delftia sp. WY8 TaxID=2708352 RepID=UPI001BCB24CE|nr:tail fiber assembly protein [Delftia sp. WY8]